MTTAPENYGNGSAKTGDRFTAQLSGYPPRPRVGTAAWCYAQNARS